MSNLMVIEELVEKTILAVGSEGLLEQLNLLSNRANNDPAFAAQGHYILYKVGAQESLIKVDFKNFEVWYYDLLGRPASANIKEIFFNFLKANNRSPAQFHDLYPKEDRLKASISGEVPSPLPPVEKRKERAYLILSEEKSLPPPAPTKTGIFGLFFRAEKNQAPAALETDSLKTSNKLKSH